MAEEEGGFHLEQLPTTYTNKLAIMGSQWVGEEGGGREGPHHGKYVMLGEKSSSTVSQTITLLLCLTLYTFKAQ